MGEGAGWCTIREREISDDEGPKEDWKRGRRRRGRKRTNRRIHNWDEWSFKDRTDLENREKSLLPTLPFCLFKATPRNSRTVQDQNRNGIEKRESVLVLDCLDWFSHSKKTPSSFQLLCQLSPSFLSKILTENSSLFCSLSSFQPQLLSVNGDLLIVWK